MATAVLATGTDVWKPNDATFGARLALIRQHLGWGNVKEAAVKCGLPSESWRTWERDGVMPHGSRYFDICAKIASATGCDYGWLVDRRPTGAAEPTLAYPSLRVASSTDNPRKSRLPGQIPFLTAVRDDQLP